MFHSTPHQMMRELDTGSAYRVQFKTSANHCLSDMDELVQNHEQELKAHDAVVKQAAERQNQLNAQLQMLYDTRMVTRVTASQMEDLQREHEAEQKEHDDKIQRAQAHKENLNAYGHQLSKAVESEKEHKAAQEAHAEAERIAAANKVAAEAAAAEHKDNMEQLTNMKAIKPKKPAKTAQPAETYLLAVTNNKNGPTHANTWSPPNMRASTGRGRGR
jgi:septal ring factor EnvC (AmiA/AmiB activator)